MPTRDLLFPLLSRRPGFSIAAERAGLRPAPTNAITRIAALQVNFFASFPVRKVAVSVSIRVWVGCLFCGGCGDF